jgi:hypothetical protein
MTYNVWGEHLWPSRLPAFEDLILSTKADVFMLQEVTPDILTALDKLVR